MIFPINHITEFFSLQEGLISIWGDSGVGKTTLSLQCALLSLKKASIIYIYTKPILPYPKIKKIIGNDSKENYDKIFFIKSTNYQELYNLILSLEFIILDNLTTKFDLVIIDSITDLYRLELNRDKKDKNFFLSYILNHILGNLTFLNQKYNLGILIINELSMKNINDSSSEAESGGNVMDYWVNNSIKIERTDKLGERKFVLVNKTSNLKSEFTSRITDTGFV
jgi:RecA/RadA recombinase